MLKSANTFFFPKLIDTGEAGMNKWEWGLVHEEKIRREREKKEQHWNDKRIAEKNTNF